jgi:transketolase
MPCTELFVEQDESFKTEIIPRATHIVTIEAGSTFGWNSILARRPKNLLHIGIDRFGASAPAKDLAEKFGFTPEAIVKAIEQRWPE